MTINREPYKVGDRHYVDKDPDNKWTYVGDFSEEMTFNATSIESCELISDRMTVLKGPTVQGNYILFQVQGPTATPQEGQEDAFVTMRVICANGDQFDDTLWFKSVEK